MKILQELRARLRYLGKSRAQRFDWIYETNYWADEESASGVGSRLDKTAELRRALPKLLDQHDCRSLLDVGCGDFNWLREVDLGDVRYLGVDISTIAIQGNAKYAGEQRHFEVLDAVETVPPQSDLVLCRDVLYHLSLADARSLLRNLVASRSKLFLLTTHSPTTRNHDIATGSFAFQNLRLEPFLLPEPLETIGDAYEETLGLWTLKQLEAAPVAA